MPSTEDDVAGNLGIAVLFELGEGLGEGMGGVEGDGRERSEGFASDGYGEGEEGRVADEGGKGMVEVGRGCGLGGCRLVFWW